MSQSEFDTNTSSAATDAAAGEPKRYAHGSGIGEAIRSRVARMKDDAERECKRFRDQCSVAVSDDYASQEHAFLRVLRVIDEIMADAATSTHEPGRRSS